MVYSKQFVASIKVNGKILREQDGKVFLPFGSEFTIILKNLNPSRALVNIYIDGLDIADGSKFVIDAGATLEITRFIKNGNLSSGNRFKFIERSQDIENHRGIQLEDGLIRVEFQFQKRHYQLQDVLKPSLPPQPMWRGTFHNDNIMRCASSHTYLPSTMSSTSTQSNAPGITVPGSKSDQKFYESNEYYDLEPEKNVIIIQLIGQSNNTLISKPITVNYKPKCISCGRNNKGNAKFCSNCGTALEIF